MRVAVTGSTGRLGGALVHALADAPFTGPAGPIAWTRREFNLDAPEDVGRLLDRDQPEVIVHCAAWTDVDGCARDPELAVRRNADATGVLARACALRLVDLIVVSTNEVFDGVRTDGVAYEPGDPTHPVNAYGRSKALGEQRTVDAFFEVSAKRDRMRAADWMIVRTAWLFGPGSPDFPTKIAAAARAAREEGRTMRVVADEVGSPTYVADVADAIVELIGADSEIFGIHHLVNQGVTSRADWARDVVMRLDLAVEVEDVPSSTWQRASTPPQWGVLAPTPLPFGEPMRSWQEAMADYAPHLRRAIQVAR